MESLVSGAVCGVTYHLFSGQPLTIIGSTGPVLVFETIVYKFCTYEFWKISPIFIHCDYCTNVTLVNNDYY